MAAKKCLRAGIDGHPKNCACHMPCCSILPDRAAQIVLDGRSGRNWAEEANQGPGCICGAGARTFMAANALRGEGPGQPTGRCARHPGGTVHREGER